MGHATSLRPYRIEACATSVDAAKAAGEAGADRIELCQDPDTGGLTPSEALIRQVLETVRVPVRILIRSTAHGFACDDIVLRQMERDILRYRDLPVEGFVFGVMRDGRIDADAMTALLTAAGNRPVTFHKAIDMSIDVEADIALLNTWQHVDTILTSGGAPTALEGIEGIRTISRLFHGVTMAAGRITPPLLPVLHAALRLPWYHGQAITEKINGNEAVRD